MANNKPCKVRSLPDAIREQVDSMLVRGIPAPSISKWLANQGHQVTVRQIYNYKDKSVPLPVLSDRQEASTYSDDATDPEMFKQLLKTTLEAVDTLRETFKLTGDLRTARVLREMTETAAGIIKYRLEHDQPDPVVNVVLQMESLEDYLGTPEVD